MGSAVIAAQKSAEGTASGVKSGVIERRRTQDATNAICAEEVFGHRKRLAEFR
jgi:hypothetical protein